MRRTYMGAVLLVWLVLLSACAALLPPNTTEAPSQNTAVRPPDPQGRTPLMQAAYAGDVTTVKALLAQGVDVNAHDYRGGKTALMYAAFKGHVEIVQTLLAAGAEVNAKAGQLDTALTFAASGCHTTTIDLLLAQGADPQASAYDGTAQDLAQKLRCPFEIQQALRGDTSDAPRLSPGVGRPPQAPIIQGLPTSLLSQAAAPSITLQRYLALEDSEEISPDTEFALQVAFTLEQVTPEVKVTAGATTAAGQLVFSLPDHEAWQGDVVISAPGFTFRGGANTAWLTLPRQGDSPPRVFYLRAKPIQGPQQVRNVAATLWYHGAFLGKVTRQVTIITSRRGTSALSVAPSPAVARVSRLPRDSQNDVWLCRQFLCGDVLKRTLGSIVQFTP